MNKDREENLDGIEGETFDGHEYEIREADNRTINWRRIELLKEKQWLKKQLDDYDDWSD